MSTELYTLLNYAEALIYSKSIVSCFKILVPSLFLIPCPMSFHGGYGIHGVVGYLGSRVSRWLGIREATSAVDPHLTGALCYSDSILWIIIVLLNTVSS